MRNVRAALLFCFCVSGTLQAWAQRSEDWLPVTAQDLEFKEVPGDAAAPVVQLYYADFRDDVRRSEFIYQRIKVLKESGERYADVEIEVPPHYSIVNLQARTIHPDKTAIAFAGKPFEKLVVKYRGEKLVAKAFTLPSVTVGSFLEFKYTLLWNQYFNNPTWIVQHDLYTVRESFWLRRYTGLMPTRHLSDQTQLSYVISNMPAGVVPKDTGPGVELEVDNVPAFKPEVSMPPDSNFKAQVNFFYGGREIESPEVFWRDIGQDWYEKAEHFIGNREQLKSVAARIIGGETDPERQLSKLYARAQQIKNVASGEPGAEVEGQPPSLKANENVMDVLKHGYGSQNEIAELFVALARAAGFSAQLLRASDRRYRIFDPKLLLENQLSTEIVRVKLKDSDLYLDPGQAFCPFGLVSWNFTSAPALQLDKNGGSFVVIPTTTAEKSIVRRTAQVVLSSDGSLQGEVTVEFTGNEAVDLRLDTRNNDNQGRRRKLEELLQTWIIQGSRVQLEGLEGGQSDAESLLARFSLKIENFAAEAGNRLAIPANLFRWPSAGAFIAAERKYPVYFPYAYEVIDKVDLQVPSGYRPDIVPIGQDVKWKATRFIITRTVQTNHLLLTGALVINSIYFQPDQYEELRNFLDKFRTAEDEQAVLLVP